jgi:hypothetical protein
MAADAIEQQARPDRATAPCLQPPYPLLTDGREVPNHTMIESAVSHAQVIPHSTVPHASRTRQERMRPASLIDRRVWASVQEKDVLRNQRIVEGMRAELGDPNSAGGWTIKLKVGRQSLIAECGFACTDALAVAKPRAVLECSLLSEVRQGCMHCTHWRRCRCTSRRPPS